VPYELIANGFLKKKGDSEVRGFKNLKKTQNKP
jgi:hypothetical protein